MLLIRLTDKWRGHKKDDLVTVEDRMIRVSKYGLRGRWTGLTRDERVEAAKRSNIPHEPAIPDKKKDPAPAGSPDEDASTKKKK